ncbi:DNA polymerase Y family protein [Tuwongella immobilis]|nr:nucleotidyltransferase [Tuwongella immobilis]
MRRAIGHLDADSFYVSSERVRDPFLKDKPVGVLGNNGACVIARSYEMKAMGVRVGEPIWDAIKRCPDGIYVKRDFPWYEVLSRQMLDETCRRSPLVEYYSIDEFFFLVEPYPIERMERLAQSIRDDIFQKTRLPVTVGLARSRTLAKLLTDTYKPFGAVAMLRPEEERALLMRLPVTAICGIAERRAKRLAMYNIRTCWDLAQMSRSLVRQLLTVTGEIIWRELNGEPVTPIQAERPPHKMLSRGGSIGWPTNDRDIIFAWIVRNLERLIEELEFHRVRIGKLTLWLNYADGDGPDTIGEHTFETVTDRFDLLLDAARTAWLRSWRTGARVVRMQLIGTHLRRSGLVQQSLFEQPNPQQVALSQVKQQINQKLGRFKLRSGATLPLREIYRDESCNYDICDVRGKICF